MRAVRPASAAGSGAAERRVRAQRASAQPIEYSILLTATLCLLAAGTVMVYSASSAPSLLQGGTGTGTLAHFVLYGSLGLVAMRVLSRRGLNLAQRFTAPLLGVSLFLLVIVRMPHIGVQINGARRWLGYGPLQFQPSELAKLALILYCAQLLALRPRRVLSLGELVRPMVLVVGVAILLIASEPDLGTGMVIAFTISALLIAAGTPLRHLAVLGLVAGVVLVMAFAVLPYSRARLTSFIDPWSHAGTTGFQSVQGQIAIGSGGLLGRGPGQSVQKAFYLPEASTDFILAVIGEELGVVGVFVLLFLYGLIAFAGLRAAKRAQSFYAAMIAVGVTTLIVSQAALNAFAVLGIAPLTGVPLPFVSYGSTDLLVILAGMGLLLHVASGGNVALHAVEARPRTRRRPAAPRRTAAVALAGPSGPALDTAGRDPQRLQRERKAADTDRNRRGGHSRARGAGAGGGRRAAG